MKTSRYFNVSPEELLSPNRNGRGLPRVEGHGATCESFDLRVCRVDDHIARPERLRRVLTADSEEAVLSAIKESRER